MSAFSIRCVDSAAAIAREDWARLAPPDSPFLNADFLGIVERHGAAGPDWGWQALHLLAQDTDGRVMGLLPAYLKHNGYGDFTGDWSWASAWKQLGRNYFPKLSSGIPHTPATGPRLLVAADAADPDAVRRALIDGAKAALEQFELSSWHLAFPDATEIEPLRAAGLAISHDVQFHWLNDGCGDFAGYLAGFSSEKRRKVRAERRKVADSGLQLEVRRGDEIDPAEWPALHALYLATFEKFDNHAVFSAACFAELAAALGRRMLAFIARERGEPVAVSICFRDDAALYGRYWGCRERCHSLHFELCFYRGIDYCLREGLQRFEPGAGGEHKIARGFTPTLVRSAHWVPDPRLRALVARHLEMQREAVAGYRDEAAGHLPFRAELMPG